MRALSEIRISRDWDSFLAFRERKLSGIQTGIKSLDRNLLGLSGIVIIQGAPGTNKSTLALQISQYQAGIGNPSLIIDRENGRERFRMRLLCMSNSVSQTDVLTCSQERLRELITPVIEYPIYVCTDAVTEYEEINTALKHLWERHKKPMLLVVDSLQALPLIAEDERLSIQKWLGLFDQCKLDWEGKLTIIITSEKSRGSDNYDRASLQSAKGSGASEYKAEMVFDLRRNKENGNVILEVIKNRDGLSGVAFELRPGLSDMNNKQSFTFRMEDAGTFGGMFG